jgi:uncharacterized integral membrane protein
MLKDLNDWIEKAPLIVVVIVASVVGMYVMVGCGMLHAVISAVD